MQKHSPCSYDTCSQGAHFNSTHKSLERITAISLLLVDKSFYFNGWNLMLHVKDKRRNRINFTITHKLFCRFSSSFGCVSGIFFFNTSSRIGFKSDLHLFITGWWGFQQDIQKIIVYHKTSSKIWCDNQCNLVLHLAIIFPCNLDFNVKEAFCVRLELV